MRRVVEIADGQIANVLLVPDDWQAPEDGSQMLESQAIAQGIQWAAMAEDKEAVYRRTIDAGYDVGAPENYRIAMDEPDITRWANYLTALREREAAGVITGETPVPFLDLTGTPRQATLTRFRQMVLGAGDAWQEAFFARHVA